MQSDPEARLQDHLNILLQGRSYHIIILGKKKFPKIFKDIPYNGLFLKIEFLSRLKVKNMQLLIK